MPTAGQSTPQSPSGQVQTAGNTSSHSTGQNKVFNMQSIESQISHASQLADSLGNLARSCASQTYWRSSLEQLHFDQIKDLDSGVQESTNISTKSPALSVGQSNLNFGMDSRTPGARTPGSSPLIATPIEQESSSNPVLQDSTNSQLVTDKFNSVPGNLDLHKMVTEKDPSLDVVEEILIQRQKIIDDALTSITVNLGKLNEASKQVKDFMIPQKLVDYIDSNRNPIVFSEKFIECSQQVSVNASNVETRLLDFRAQLLLETAKIFPEDTLKYKKLAKL